ncbi:MAG: hypothetical protein KME09_24095 [Pleurocapsa minor HA4230-MV1]|nr:hypothetical protein [Pleurocapsa minor HA4230-MV1]
MIKIWCNYDLSARRDCHLEELPLVWIDSYDCGALKLIFRPSDRQYLNHFNSLT